MWVKDHYIFYINAKSMDSKDQSICYKRYTNFEDFHERMESIFDNKKISFLLPHLPKKHPFGDVSEQIEERKLELEAYLRDISNNYQIMMTNPEAR